MFLIGILIGFQLFEDGEVCQLTALYSELPIMARLLRAKNRRLHLIKSFQVRLMNMRKILKSDSAVFIFPTVKVH